MKTLYVTPNTGNDQLFYLCDIETGEILASHYCSHEGFAKGDLYENRPEREEEFTKKYNSEIKIKFFNEQHEVTDYEFTRLNKNFARKIGLYKERKEND